MIRTVLIATAAIALMGTAACHKKAADAAPSDAAASATAASDAPMAATAASDAMAAPASK